ncbi:MAG: hypothetical protein DRN15_09260 [Thermoprotei archaeon]|nr:MAG: hypothetical protein DRN15_09260 [Thermoprotei archaeon]RLF24495.1 MAG: hypothetical protein DRM97_03370 [Thermoprotei archaeon]
MQGHGLPIISTARSLHHDDIPGKLHGGNISHLDRQFGFLKAVLVAPVSRELVIIGRGIGDSIIALMNGSIMLILGIAIGAHLNPQAIPMVLLIGFIVALGFTSIGIMLGSIISNPEGFHVITGLITLPMILLSGAFFPLDQAPSWMQILALLIPLTYATDLSRILLTNTSYLQGAYSWLTPGLELIILIILVSLFTLLATKIFKETTI